MPRIPMMKTKFPSQAYIQTRGPKVGNIRRFRYEPGRNGDMVLMKGPDNLWWETKYEPLQGPDLPRDVEKYRQQMIDAMESGNTRRGLSRTRAYEDAWANERARQAYNRKLIEEAVRLRKEELWREYMEAEDPAPGIGWPEGKAEQLDEEFENMANWDVQGYPNPNLRTGEVEYRQRGLEPYLTRLGERELEARADEMVENEYKDYLKKMYQRFPNREAVREQFPAEYNAMPYLEELFPE